MKTERVRYILLGVGVLVALVFGVMHFASRSAPPPVIITGTLPPVTETAPAQIAPSPASSHKRRARPSPDAAVSPDDAGTITVDVEGAVKHPKVYQIASGARIVQALSAAGGITPDADVSSVNQAARLADGDQVLVLTKEQTAAHTRRSSSHARSGRRKKAGGGSSKTPQKILSGTININTATLEQLEQIPGVGKVTAQRILDERQKIGSFRDSSDLMEIDGMTPGKYEKMRPFISIF